MSDFTGNYLRASVGGTNVNFIRYQPSIGWMGMYYQDEAFQLIYQVPFALYNFLATHPRIADTFFSYRVELG